jgi:O-antigen/teichoic acid export membrane protein
MSFIRDVITTNPKLLFQNKNLRKNIGNSFYYFGGTFLQFIIAIFTQPIFSRYLELEDFAVIGYFSAIQAILFPLFNMSLPFYYLSKYYNTSNGKPGHENLSFILNFLNISNGFIAIFSFGIISLYFKVFNISFPLLPFVFIVIAQLFFEKFKTFYLLECRINKQGLRFFLINLLQIIVNTGFSLYFVISLNGGAAGRMSGILLGVVVSSFIALTLLLTEKKYIFTFNIDKTKIKPALKYCIPLIIGSYAYFPIGNIDRLFLERLGNITEYGYYSIGLTISGFAGTFFLALYQSFEPDLYRLIAQKKYKQYGIFAFLYMSLIAVLSILFLLFSGQVVSFLTDGRYTYASVYANIFILGIVLMQAGGFFEQLFTAFGKTKLAMWRNIIMGVFSILLYYALIRNFQFFGANIARVIISGVYVLVGAILFTIFIKRNKYETN